MEVFAKCEKCGKFINTHTLKEDVNDLVIWYCSGCGKPIKVMHKTELE